MEGTGGYGGLCEGSWVHVSMRIGGWGDDWDVRYGERDRRFDLINGP